MQHFDPLTDEFIGWLFELPERAEALLKMHPEIAQARSAIGETPLHYLVVEDMQPAVTMLLRHGADPNSQNEFGETPLHNAVSLGYTDTVRILLRYGADPHVPDENGQLPLHLVAGMGDVPELARLLVEKGADVNGSNGFGTALDEALRYNSLEMVAMLLELGADVNRPAMDGWTPLAIAVEYGQPMPVLELLVARGADPRATNHGETAVDLARRYQRHDVAAWLTRGRRTPARRSAQRG